MKTIFQVLLSLTLVTFGVAQAQDWSTNRFETPRFKAVNHGWSASTQPRRKIFNPIVLPKINILPRVHVTAQYSTYASQRADSVVRFKYLESGSYR